MDLVNMLTEGETPETDANLLVLIHEPFSAYQPREEIHIDAVSSGLARKVERRASALEEALRRIETELDPNHLADHDEDQIDRHIESAYLTAFDILAAIDQQRKPR